MESISCVKWMFAVRYTTAFEYSYQEHAYTSQRSRILLTHLTELLAHAYTIRVHKNSQNISPGSYRSIYWKVGLLGKIQVNQLTLFALSHSFFFVFFLLRLAFLFLVSSLDWSIVSFKLCTCFRHRTKIKFVASLLASTYSGSYLNLRSEQT